MRPSPAALLEQGFYIADTGRTGLGVFASRSLRAGETVLVIEGAEREWRSVDHADALANPNWIGIGEHRWIEPIGLARFLNHSCEPTMGLREPRSFVALRDIAPGEELTFDYALTEDEPLWRMTCRCGSRSCRGEVRAVQFLSAREMQERLPYVPSYFRRVWEAGRGSG